MRACLAIIVLMSVSPLLAQQAGCNANYQVIGEHAAQSAPSGSAISDISVARTYGLGCLTTEAKSTSVRAQDGSTLMTHQASYSAGTATIIGHGQSYGTSPENMIDCGPTFSVSAANDATIAGAYYYNVVQDRTAAAQGCENAAYRQDYQTISTPLAPLSLSANGLASPSSAVFPGNASAASCATDDCTVCKSTYRRTCEASYTDCQDGARAAFVAAVLLCAAFAEAPPAYFICAGAALIAERAALNTCATNHNNCIALIDQNCFSQCHP